jgi:hypothetical protein
MTLEEIAARITPELLAEAIKIGTKGQLLEAVVAAGKQCPAFEKVMDACLAAGKIVPLGTSPSREHLSVRTAIIGGIQLGIVLGQLAEKRGIN